jgi:hypothetical protein
MPDRRSLFKRLIAAVVFAGFARPGQQDRPGPARRQVGKARLKLAAAQPT